jgi:hypothetical protein
MDNFLRYFFQDIGRVFQALIDVFVSLGNFLNYLLNFPMRMNIIKEYSDEFATLDWVLLLVANIILIALIALMIFGLFKLCKKIFRFGVSPKKYDALQKQLRSLQRDLLRSNYEKDKLFAMKVEQINGGEAADDLTISGDEANETEGEEQSAILPVGNRNTFISPCVDPSESRFFRLTSIDNFYKTQYTPPEYNSEFDLESLCDVFR